MWWSLSMLIGVYPSDTNWLGKTGLTVGGTIAWVGDPGLYQARKVNSAQACIPCLLLLGHECNMSSLKGLSWFHMGATSVVSPTLRDTTPIVPAALTSLPWQGVPWPVSQSEYFISHVAFFFFLITGTDRQTKTTLGHSPIVLWTILRQQQEEQNSVC